MLNYQTFALKVEGFVVALILTLGLLFIGQSQTSYAVSQETQMSSLKPAFMELNHQDEECTDANGDGACDSNTQE